MVELTEKKVPKGVPLQFDINSVGKPVRAAGSPVVRLSAGVLITVLPPQQTAMTLNERFRILKDKRAATAQTSKGSRFVTVG